MLRYIIIVLLDLIGVLLPVNLLSNQFYPNSCWSSVGQKVSIPGPQLLSIGPGCDKKGIIMHELMHAAGFWHEQSRTDRNKYVEILWENVAEGRVV